MHHLFGPALWSRPQVTYGTTEVDKSQFKPPSMWEQLKIEPDCPQIDSFLTKNKDKVPQSLLDFFKTAQNEHYTHITRQKPGAAAGGGAAGGAKTIVSKFNLEIEAFFKQLLDGANPKFIRAINPRPKVSPLRRRPPQAPGSKRSRCRWIRQGFTISLAAGHPSTGHDGRAVQPAASARAAPLHRHTRHREGAGFGLHHTQDLSGLRAAVRTSPLQSAPCAHHHTLHRCTAIAAASSPVPHRPHRPNPSLPAQVRPSVQLAARRLRPARQHVRPRVRGQAAG